MQIKPTVSAVVVACAALAGCDKSLKEATAELTAQPKVPSQLFDIKLGGKYRTRHQSFASSDLPIAKVTGAERSLDSGTHVYFQPKKPYPAFPYVEKKKGAEEYFSTSYRAYLLPVIPAGTKSIEELQATKDVDYEVLLIEWSTMRPVEANEEAKSADYFWAVELCKTFEADLSLKPTVIDQFDPKGAKQSFFGTAYSCTFTEGERQMEVSSLFGRSVKLEFVGEAMRAKNDAFELAVRKLKAPSVRPY